jgi:predicted MPP superfamily phosphohydrolase
MDLLKYSKILIPAIWLAAGFIVLDGIWLALLPRLGISYGKVAPTWTAFAFLRAGLFFVWLVWLVWLGLIGANALQKHTIWGLVALNLLLLGVGLDAFYVEPMQLTVGRIAVPLPGLSRPVRIVQLTDIHVERTTRREQALPGLVESLHPDMLVLTGDYLNQSFTHDAQAAADLRLLLGQLHAPLGIYAVNGNVETPEEMDNLIAGLGIRALHNEVVRIPALDDHFALVGLDYTDWLSDQVELHFLMQDVKPGDFSLLLYHTPDQAYAARDLHVNLYLAGHTHGGQVRLPLFGAVFTNSRYGKTFEMGQYHLGQTTLNVSRGLGMTGGSAPRARFLCLPEVMVVDLVPAGAAGNP